MNIPENSIRIMTFNILYDYGADKENSWVSRKDFAFSLLRFHAPDIFCLQEPLQNQVNDFSAFFPDYHLLSAGCIDGKTEGQHISIFFLKDKFDILDSGMFGLSEEPEKIGVTGWDAKNPRLALWVKLIHKITKCAFFVINTHFDHKGETARQQSAILLTGKTQEIAGDLPVLLCGDFNANSSSQPYKIITDNGFTDCSNISDAINYNLPYTYHKFLLGKDITESDEHIGDLRVLKVIDHIFYKGKIKVLRHGILNDNYLGMYPSDHLPKLCDIVLM